MHSISRRLGLAPGNDKVASRNAVSLRTLAEQRIQPLQRIKEQRKGSFSRTVQESGKSRGNYREKLHRDAIEACPGTYSHGNFEAFQVCLFDEFMDSLPSESPEIGRPGMVANDERHLAIEHSSLLEDSSHLLHRPKRITHVLEHFL